MKPDRDEQRKRESSPDRPEPRRDRLSPGEVWRLIAATYRTSLPYLLVFLAGLLLATWLFTELVF